MSQTVLLIRHAQAAVKPGRLTGWTPGVHLSETGQKQAAALAERLREVRLTALYASPLERCQQTAAAIADGRRLQVVTDEEIGEVKYGSWQGKSTKNLVKKPMWRVVQMAPSQAVFPGGESLRELQTRTVDAVERIRRAHKKGVVAIVTHADVVKAVSAHYLGMHLDLYQRISVDTASVTAFSFQGTFVRLLRLSDTGSYADLSPPAAPQRRSGKNGKPANAKQQKQT